MNADSTIQTELPPQPQSTKWAEALMHNLANPIYAKYFHLGRAMYSPTMSPVATWFSLPKPVNCRTAIAMPAFQHGWECESNPGLHIQENQNEQGRTTQQESSPSDEREGQARREGPEAAAPDAKQPSAGSAGNRGGSVKANAWDREKAAPAVSRCDRTFNLQVGNWSELFEGSFEQARARVEELFQKRHVARGGGWRGAEWRAKNKFYAANGEHAATVEVGSIRELK